MGFWQKKTKILGLSGPLASHPAYFESFSLNMQYPELLVASYNNNEDAPHEPDGVALVWNMKYKKTTPEYVFHCQVCFCLGRDFIFMNLDEYLPHVCQYNNFIGLAFTLTTFICQQMLIARDFSWENYSVSEFLTSFRIQSFLRTPFFFYLKKRKAFLCNGWTTKVCM